ncbi:MAG: hypothetical protein NDJ89_07670 [Oligoflexia bacterium]|nr:hypothetical protein [Oligoflexia bacterium]
MRHAAIPVLLFGALALGAPGCIEFVRDRTPPAPVPSLNDGVAWPSTSSSPSLSWSYPGTGNSYALDRFEVALGTSPGATDLLDWVTVGSSTQAAGVSGLSLALGGTYYASVRAVDSAGQVSSPTTSAGWKVVPQLSVFPRYAAGSDWNSYVDAADTSLPCSGSGQGYYSCLHGGEKRRVDFPGELGCADLRIRDELEAFDWSCDDTGGASGLFFHSRGLKREKGLGHLLEASSWKPERVVIFRGAEPIAASLPSFWWANPVVTLPQNSAENTLLAISGSGTIYTIPQSMTVRGGYRFSNTDSHRIAVVALPGAVLTFSGSTPACGWGPETINCLLELRASDYFWVEGAFSGTGSISNQTGLASRGVFSVIRNARFTGFQNAVGGGSALYSGRIGQSRFFNNRTGLYLSTHRSVLQDLLFLGNEESIDLPSAQVELVLQSITFEGGRVSLFNARDSVLAGITSFSDILFSAGLRNTIHNLHGPKLEFMSANDNTASQLAIQNVSFTLTSGNKFTGLWTTLSAPVCSMISSPSAGLDAGCANQGASDATLISGSGAYAPVGKVFLDDTKNVSDVLGGAAFDSITDWLNFENPWRGWGPDTTPCQKGGSCRIWDYRLSSSDTYLRNTTGNGLSQNPSFEDGDPCPAPLDGNVVSTDQSASARTFLRNATEILGWGNGNNNGLCESGETCLYTPNFGAYQGEGDFTSKSCVFKNGIVTGVKIYAYPINGVP